MSRPIVVTSVTIDLPECQKDEKKRKYLKKLRWEKNITEKKSIFQQIPPSFTPKKTKNSKT